jgi:membrane-associated phospholipid phosphatase
MTAGRPSDAPATDTPHRAADAGGADQARTQRANVGALLIALLSLVGFVALTVAVASGFVFPFDQPWLALARTWDGWPFIWQAMSQSANIPLIVIGLGFVLWLIRQKRRREAVLVILILVAVTAGSEGIKQLVARPRPSGTGDGIPGVVYSYPSGHVLEVLTILGIIALRSWRSARSLRLRLAFVILVAIEVVLVGVARLALNAHYPTDVLAGLLGAIGALGLYAWFTRPGGWADKPARETRDTRERPEGS